MGEKMSRSTWHTYKRFKTCWLTCLGAVGMFFFSSHLITTIFQYRNYCCWQRCERKTSRTLTTTNPTTWSTPTLSPPSLEMWDGGRFLCGTTSLWREKSSNRFTSVKVFNPPSISTIRSSYTTYLSLVSNQHPAPNAQPALESRGQQYWCIRFTGIWDIQDTFRYFRILFFFSVVFNNIPIFFKFRIREILGRRSLVALDYNCS